MSSAEQEPTVRRAIDELRRLPALDRDAVQRVVQAAAIARVSPADADPADLPRGRSIRVWSAVGIATAAAVAGFAIGGLVLSRPSTVAAPSVASVVPESGVQTIPVARNASELAPIPQQFVLEQADARRVSVVGDFNNWNPKANPMLRDASGIWSVILPVVPGRHVYGYMVDDSVFTLDPRKPTTRDPDLGGEGSVLMVGRP